jgi:hypothetical protein
MSNTEQNRAALLDMIEHIMTGRLLDGFAKHYHDDVVMSENNDPAQTTVGKEANTARETWFVTNATWHGVKLGPVMVDGDHSAYEMFMDYSVGDTRITTTQIARQEWKDGQIIREVFYYNKG